MWKGKERKRKEKKGKERKRKGKGGQLGVVLVSDDVSS